MRDLLFFGLGVVTALVGGYILLRYLTRIDLWGRNP
jgi:hypothetical protein